MQRHQATSRNIARISPSTVLISALDLRQRTRRLVDVEVAVDRDLVADLGFREIDPGIGPVRLHFPFEVRLAMRRAPARPAHRCRPCRRSRSAAAARCPAAAAHSRCRANRASGSGLPLGVLQMSAVRVALATARPASPCAAATASAGPPPRSALSRSASNFVAVLVELLGVQLAQRRE